MSTFKSFETERLILKPTSRADGEFILALVNSPKWLQFIGDRKIKTVADAKDYISNKMLPQLHRLGFGNYTVVRKEDGTKIGTCGLYDREGLDGIDLGIAFLPEYEGKGYGFEAAAKVVKMAFENFNIKALQAITSKNNALSQKLLVNLYFELVGSIVLPNETEELYLFKAELNEDFAKNLTDHSAR
jgi:ribosomal-protein-alanine N-acetyltransferase